MPNRVAQNNQMGSMWPAGRQFDMLNHMANENYVSGKGTLLTIGLKNLNHLCLSAFLFEMLNH